MKIEPLSYPFSINQFKDYVWGHFSSNIPLRLANGVLVAKENDPDIFYNNHYGKWESRCRRYIPLLAEVDGTPQIVFQEEEDKSFFNIFLPYLWGFSEKVQTRKHVLKKCYLPPCLL